MTAPTPEASLAYLSERLFRPPFHGFLVPQIVSVGDGRVALLFRHKREYQRTPDAGFTHGGVLAACVDITGHAALSSLLLRPIPTIDLRVDYLRPAKDTDLHASARVVRAGASVGVVDVEIAGDDGRTLVLGRCLFHTAP